MSQLDARLARVERALGTADFASASPTVLPALQQLESRLALLDDAAFALMESRAKLLLGEVSGGGSGASTAAAGAGVSHASATPRKFGKIGLC